MVSKDNCEQRKVFMRLACVFNCCFFIPKFLTILKQSDMQWLLQLLESLGSLKTCEF